MVLPGGRTFDIKRRKAFRQIQSSVLRAAIRIGLLLNLRKVND